MDWRTQEGDRQVIRHALGTRNQDLLSGVIAAMAFTGLSEQVINDEVLDAFAEQDEDTRHWWGGPCNCQGQHN